MTVLSDQETGEEPAAGDSSPNNSNSGTSSFQMDFTSIFKKSRKRDLELVTSLRGGNGGGMSDDDENGLTRKKLRLTKEQSAFLEDSFKEHSTLNPVSLLSLSRILGL